MRPLSARSDAEELRKGEDDEGGGVNGTGDEGLRSSVTWTSCLPEFGVPQEEQNRADSRGLLPQCAQKGMQMPRF
jgi:hypothetical protein